MYLERYMRHILELSGEYPDLAAAEARALLRPKKATHTGQVLLVDCADISQGKRLAYTKRIFLFLFEATHRHILKKIEAFAWDTYYKKSFMVRLINPGKRQFFIE